MTFTTESMTRPMSRTTSLPSLPSLKKKREANLTPSILKWFRENGPSCCAIEIKVTDKKRIPKSALLPHQKQALMDVYRGGIVYKLTDEARREQPFDAFKLAFAKGFVVACFTGAGARVCKVIDVREWEGADADTRSVYEFEC